MAKDGLITLPPPLRAKPSTYRASRDVEHATEAPPVVPEIDLGTLTVDLVNRRYSSLWNGYIQRYHYLARIIREKPTVGSSSGLLVTRWSQECLFSENRSIEKLYIQHKALFCCHTYNI
jgi:hypothetical protein